MAIQFIGSATGTTSATLPAHVAGDVILAFAFRTGSNTAPSLPSGWTNIRNDGANTCSGRIAFRIATNSSTVSGTWTNASNVVFLVYRNALQSGPIGNNNTATAVSTTVNYPALSNSSGSIVVGFAGHRATNVTLSAPTGMVNRDTTTLAAGHDTDGPIDGWSSTNTAVGGSSSGWRTYVVEIKVEPVNATATTTGLEVTTAAGVSVQTSNDWFAWFFDRSEIVFTSAEGNVVVAGESVDTQAGQVQAQGEQNGLAPLASLDILAAQGVLIATGAALIALDGQQSAGSLGEPSASGQGVAGIDGLEAQTEFGEVTASEGVDATATVTGLTLTAHLGQVKAETVSPETIVGGSWHKRYPVSIEKSAVATIAGLGSIIGAGSVRAMGVVQISAVANLQPLQAVTELTPTQANGVLDLSDDEILLLLAA